MLLFCSFMNAAGTLREGRSNYTSIIRICNSNWCMERGEGSNNGRNDRFLCVERGVGSNNGRNDRYLCVERSMGSNSGRNDRYLCVERGMGSNNGRNDRYWYPWSGA